MKNIKLIVLSVTVLLTSGCDFINRSSRTMDTMLGGDYEVHVQGFEKPFHVNNGKITSQPDKGYYIFYPTINGKRKLVQSPINLTTIIEKD
jgi:outer membrane lipopolysaccharide assembly protein LptE/RlpB